MAPSIAPMLGALRCLFSKDLCLLERGPNPKTGPLPGRARELLGRNLGHDLEAPLLEVQVEAVSRASEPVLGHLEDSAAEQLGPLVLLDRELHHRVHHVLEHVPTRELSVFTDLADHDRAGVVLLAPVRDEGQSTLRRPTVGRSVGVLAVVHRLEAVHHEDELLVRVLSANLVALLEKRGDVNLLAHRETVLEAESLRRELHLVERLLSGVEDPDGSVAHQAVHELEHHGRLTRTRGSGEEGHGRGGDTLAAERTVDVLDAGLDSCAKGLGDLHVEDVGSEVESVLSVELHLFSLSNVVASRPV